MERLLHGPTSAAVLPSSVDYHLMTPEELFDVCCATSLVVIATYTVSGAVVATVACFVVVKAGQAVREIGRGHDG